MYPFDICNKFINFDTFDYLIVVRYERAFS